MKYRKVTGQQTSLPHTSRNNVLFERADGLRNVGCRSFRAVGRSRDMPRPQFPGLWARRRPLTSLVSAASASATLLLATAAPARADIHTWVGGGSNGSWSDASKWAGGIPGFDSAEQRPIIVRFDTNTVSTMNISGLVIDAIQFQGSGNVINGTGSQTLGLLGTQLSTNLSSGAGANRIDSSLPISLGGQLVTVNSAAGFLTLEGPITGGANTTLKFSAGQNAGTALAGSIATGRTLVASGQLGLDNAGAAAAVQSGIVQVGDGDDEAATLKAFRGNELSSNADVFVNGDGTYDLGLHTQSVVKTLTVDRGAVKVDDSLGMTGGFSASGGTVSGAGTLGLLGDATLTSAASGTPVTISTRMELAGERTFTVNNGPAATDATLTGVISDVPGETGALVKAGAGTLRLNPPSSNTYGGRTLIREGTLELQAQSGRAIPQTTSLLEIGDNVGPASSASVVELSNNDLNQTTPVRVGIDGRLVLGGFNDTIASLRNLGVVDLLAASTLSVVGDASVSSRVTGTGVLRLGIGGPSSLTLPSTPVGPPRIESQVQLFSATEIFVTDGITAELAGGFGPAPNNASPAVTKVGFGTLTLARQPANGPLGLTTVSHGTVIMNGLVSSPFAVAAGATLAGNGVVGALSVGGPGGGVAVGGTVAPSAPGLTASDVTFAAGGRLQSVIPASGAVPSLTVSAGATIDPAAILDLQLAPGVARATAPSQFSLITKTAPGPISGRFMGVAEGAQLTPGPGLGYTFGYSAGDGNDLVGQLRNAAPVSAITGFPSGRAAVQAGTPLVLAASATDADGDPLTFTWEFGDGATATGATVTHVYGAGAAGARTATVTVSDGRLSRTATIPVDVTSPPTPTPAPPSGGDPPGPGLTPLADTLAPGLTFTLAKGQKLSKKGTINATLQCTEACTATVATSVKPPGKKAKTRFGMATVELQAGAPTTVAVAVPKRALPAVQSGLRRKQKITLTVTATARDRAGNAGKPIQVKAALRR